MNLYSEERYDDDQLVEKVGQVAKARAEALEKASDLLEEAVAVLRRYSAFVGDEAYERQVVAVAKTSRSLTSAHKASVSRSTDKEYLRQQAGGILGMQIENMGRSFPL